jgi:hypothetical protein
MTDIQILTVVIAIVIPLSLVIANDVRSTSRINETRDLLRAEMAAGFERMEKLLARLEARFDILEAKLTLMDTKLAMMDTKIEQSEKNLTAALKIHELEHHR